MSGINGGPNQQPAQWRYSVPRDDVSEAYYPGEVLLVDTFRDFGRMFLGKGASFNGAWGGYDVLEGLSPLDRALHNWLPRDSEVWAKSPWGAICLSGASQASDAVNWPGSIFGATPATIGVAASGINDTLAGQVWGGYYDAVIMPGMGVFTTATEHTTANFGFNIDAGPFSLAKIGFKGGTIIHTQSGAGMSLIPLDLLRIGLTPLDVNHTTAIQTFLPMQTLQSTYPAYANNTNYSLGQIATDTEAGVFFRCAVPHVSPASGTFAQARAANPTYWKQNPGSLTGFIFGAGSLAERGAGSNFFRAFAFTERTFLEWTRENNLGLEETSMRLWCDYIADGTPAITLFGSQGRFVSNVNWAGDADGTYGAKIEGRGAGGGHSFSFKYNEATLKTEVYLNNVLVGRIDP